MHIIKKQLLTVLALTAALFFWTGCGGGSESSTEDALAADAEKAAAASESDMEKAKAEAEKMAKEAEEKAKEAADALNK